MLINQAFAKETAIDFLKDTKQELDPTLIGRVVKQVKGLLMAGYSEEEITYTINFVLKYKAIHSFGYIEKAIEDLAVKYRAEIKKQETREVVKSMKVEEKKTRFIDNGSEVVTEDEATERNRRKAERLGVQRRVREKSYFDLFEGQREDS